MNKIVNFIKNDIRNVREALRYTFKREIPNWIFIPYYAVGAVFGIMLLPFIGLWILWVKFELWRLTRR